MTIKFTDPCGDAAFDVGFWGVGGATLPQIATDHLHGTHIKCWNLRPNQTDNAVKTAVVADAGGRYSVFMYLVAAPTTTRSVIRLKQTGDATAIISLRMTSAGTLQLWNNTGQIGTDGATLSTGQWYRVCVAWKITNTTTYDARLFVDAATSISITNGTALSDVTMADIYLGQSTADTAFDFRLSDFYLDDSNALTDVGNVLVTAKRPFGDGTAIDFTTQIGSGNSGYGSGHADEVNERAESDTNGWSLATTSSTTKNEEYNIEALSAGDVNLTGATIMGVMGWVCGNLSSTSSQTAGIIVDGTYTAKTVWVTSGHSYFTQVSPNPTTYPAGTGTDIGMRKVTTTTSSRTGRLFECGIVVAYIPAVAASGPANLKTVNGLVKASISKIDALAMASVKTWEGLA